MGSGLVVSNRKKQARKERVKERERYLSPIWDGLGLFTVEALREIEAQEIQSAPQYDLFDTITPARRKELAEQFPLFDRAFRWIRARLMPALALLQSGENRPILHQIVRIGMRFQEWILSPKINHFAGSPESPESDRDLEYLRAWRELCTYTPEPKKPDMVQSAPIRAPSAGIIKPIVQREKPNSKRSKRKGSGMLFKPTTLSRIVRNMPDCTPGSHI
jgi:hypothetical protein